MVKMAECSDDPDPLLNDDCIEEELDKARNSNLVEGDTWYLVPTEWLEEWRMYMNSAGNVPAGNPPGPIDLSPLLDEEKKDEMKLNMLDEYNYSLVPEDCWQKLEKRFGVKDGQKPISRKVISYGVIAEALRVEVYLPEIELMKDFDESTSHKVKVSIVEKPSRINAMAKELFKVTRDVPTQFWVQLPSTINFEQVRDSGDTSNTHVLPGTIYVLEIQNEGKWPSNEKCIADKIKGTIDIGNGSDRASVRSSGEKRTLKPVSSAVGSSSLISPLSTMKNNHTNSNGVRGVCGLSNLGNTCFMNSVLQCLSNTPPLVQFFLDDSYIGDLNEENPLGMRGEIARSFADLIKQMWSGIPVATPISFKTAVSKFASQFYGFQQHDAQELLTFLLDGLHEDLNRIREKPYINLRDSDGRPDQEVAKEAWENYLKRNDSVIVDLFHGQLKSTVVCPTCNMISVTFDPFCYLSLPLPTKDKEIEVFLYPYSHEDVATRYNISVPHRGIVADVFKALSDLTPYTKNQFVAAEFVNGHFHKMYATHDLIEQSPLKVYQLPKAVNDMEYAVLPVCHAVEKRSSRCLPENGDQQPFGQPVFVQIPRKDCTYRKFINELMRRLHYCVNMDVFAGGGGIQVVNGSSSSSMYSRSKDSDDGDSDDYEDRDGEDSDDDKDKDSMDVDNSAGALAIMKNRNSNMMETDAASDDGDADVDASDESPSIYFCQNKQLRHIPSNVDDHLNFPKNFGNHYILVVWTERKKTFYREDEARKVENHSSFRRSVKSTQLTDCLSLYTREEKLDANDAWYCPKCKNHVEAAKKFDVWKLPKILVVHLKRFQYNRYRRDKIETLVEFPITGLDLRKYVIDPNNKLSTTYDLIGVCNHYGSLVGGHYTAYGLNREMNKWYCFDDTHVQRIDSTQDLVRQNAYVLFYQRNDGDHD